MTYLQRKYIDLIRHVSSKWANWDPPIPVEVGEYGEIDSETGELRVSGNIYHTDFQVELDKLGLGLHIADHPPQEGGVEEDFIVSSKGAKRVDLHLGPEVGIAGFANASFKGQWQFEQGKRDALLIMHRPRLNFLPNHVILDTLFRVPKLKDKWLVTSVYLCPAFSMYLSNKSGEKVSLALVAQVPVAGAAGITAGASGGFGWHSNASADLFRKACDEAGQYKYTPLYALKRPVRLLNRLNRLFRGKEDIEDQLSGDDHRTSQDLGDSSATANPDDLLADAPLPWEPLDEDGETDSLALQTDEEEEEDPIEI